MAGAKEDEHWIVEFAGRVTVARRVETGAPLAGPRWYLPGVVDYVVNGTRLDFRPLRRLDFEALLDAPAAV